MFFATKCIHYKEISGWNDKKLTKGSQIPCQFGGADSDGQLTRFCHFSDKVLLINDKSHLLRGSSFSVATSGCRRMLRKRAAEAAMHMEEWAEQSKAARSCLLSMVDETELERRPEKVGRELVSLEIWYIQRHQLVPAIWTTSSLRHHK